MHKNTINNMILNILLIVFYNVFKTIKSKRVSACLT